MKQIQHPTEDHTCNNLFYGTVFHARFGNTLLLVGIDQIQRLDGLPYSTK